MRGGWFAVVLMPCVLLASLEARAVDVTLGWDAATRWTSNVLNSSENEQDDFSLRTGPVVEIDEQRGDVTGRLRWMTLWEGFLDTSGADTFEHFGTLDGAWQINARNRLRISNDLARTDSLTSQLVIQDDLPSPTGQDVEAGRTSTLRNNATLSFAHQWTPRVSLEASVSNSLYDFEDEDRSDGLSTRGSVQAVRALSEVMSLGVGAAFTRQDFDETEFASGTGSEIIEVFGIWNYQITPTLLLTSSLGPAWNRPDEFDDGRFVPEVPTNGGFLVAAATCPQRSDGSRVFAAGCQFAVAENLDTGQTGVLRLASGSVPIVRASFLDGGAEAEDALTLFGSLSLIKQWERSSARLSVQRRTSAASGNGVSTDLTSATASYSWQPERRWQLTALAGWSLQTSASDVPLTEIVVEPGTLFVDATGRLVDDPALATFRADGAAISAGLREAGSTDSALESTTYQVQFLASRQISRRLTARGRVSLFRFESSGDLQSDRTTDALRLEVGLRWEFDPLRL